MQFRRLSTQIYLTVLVCLVALVIVAGGLWRRSMEEGPVRSAFEVASGLASAALPAADAPKSELEAALAELARSSNADIAVFSENREEIARVGEGRIRPPPRWRNREGFFIRRGRPAWAIALSDGRWLVARPRDRRGPRPFGRFIFFLTVVGVVVGLGAWPVVRGLTRRLERLRDGVESFGEGDLATRVDVAGRDEIATLAQSFNRSAERIEKLVESHSLLLANASHELRTPLTRIRMGLELIEDDAPAKVRDGLRSDITELDEMIEEIMVLSRLDRGATREELERRERVDLLALLAEEGARYPDCEVRGERAELLGDAKLLRRMVRNLLENASKHGAPPVTATLEVERSGEIILTVADEGAGIPLEQRDLVFEPFHRGARARSRVRGSGLGLALVREVAALHGAKAGFAADEQGRLNRVVVRFAKT